MTKGVAGVLPHCSRPDLLACMASTPPVQAHPAHTHTSRAGQSSAAALVVHDTSACTPAPPAGCRAPPQHARARRAGTGRSPGTTAGLRRVTPKSSICWEMQITLPLFRHLECDGSPCMHASFCWACDPSAWSQHANQGCHKQSMLATCLRVRVRCEEDVVRLRECH